MNKWEYPPWPSERINIFVAECLQQVANRAYSINIPLRYSILICKNINLANALKLIRKKRKTKGKAIWGVLFKNNRDLVIILKVLLQSLSSYTDDKTIGNNIRLKPKRLKAKVEKESKIFAQEQIKQTIDRMAKKEKKIRVQKEMMINELDKLNNKIDYSFQSLRNFLKNIGQLYNRRKIEARKRIKKDKKLDSALKELDSLFISYVKRIKTLDSYY